VRISLSKRPCVRAAREDLKSSRVGFWGSLFSFMPHVSFKWLWMYNAEDFPETVSEVRDGAIKSTGWSGNVGINLFTYPFDVWQSKTSVNKSKLSLLSKRLLVLKEAKEVWLEWQRASENLNLANSMSLAAEEAERLARTQYELGLISSIDLFRASNDRLDAEIAYTAAVYDCKLVGSKLQYVVGGQEVLR
jgi:outer membrane protein TolC